VFVTPGWKGQGRDIGWLEAIAIELVIRTLAADGLKDTNVLIHSDNQGVIGAFQRGCSHNFQVNLCVRRVESITMDLNIALIFTYIAAEQNKADPISHGEVGLPANHLAIAQLPEELMPYISAYV